MKIAVAIVSILLSLSASAFAEPCPHLDGLNKPSSDKSVVFNSVREAALSGNTACQLLLGNMYGFGIGTQSNEMRSHRWYTIAALSGDVGARVELARFFGQDRQRNVYDPVLTYALLASSDSSSTAADALAYWRKKITASELDEATSIAQLLERRPKH